MSSYNEGLGNNNFAKEKKERKKKAHEHLISPC